MNQAADHLTAFGQTAAAIAAEVKAEVRRILRPSLDDARRLIGEAGIPHARSALRSALDVLEAAQRQNREAQQTAQVAQETYDQAVLEAEWELDGRLVREGNKTFLVTPGTADDETDEKRRQLTADEARAWKQAEARKMPAVAEALVALRRANDRVLDTRDAVAVAEKRISACTHELDASVAQLNLLAVGLAASDHRKD